MTAGDLVIRTILELCHTLCGDSGVQLQVPQSPEAAESDSLRCIEEVVQKLNLLEPAIRASEDLEVLNLLSIFMRLCWSMLVMMRLEDNADRRMACADRLSLIYDELLEKI